MKLPQKVSLFLNIVKESSLKYIEASMALMTESALVLDIVVLLK